MTDTEQFPELAQFPESSRDLTLAIAQSKAKQVVWGLGWTVGYFALLLAVVVLFPSGWPKLGVIVGLIAGRHWAAAEFARCETRRILREFQHAPPNLADYESLIKSIDRPSAPAETAPAPVVAMPTPISAEEAPAASRLPTPDATKSPDALRIAYIAFAIMLAGMFLFFWTSKKPPLPAAEVQFTDEIVSRLRSTASQLQSEQVSPLALRLSGVYGLEGTISLQPLWQQCKRVNFACHLEVEKFQRELHDQINAASATATPEAIALVVKHSSELTDIGIAGAPKQRIGEDLFAVAVLNVGARFRYLTDRDLRQLGLSVTAAMEVARTNLIRHLPPLPAKAADSMQAAGFGMVPTKSEFSSGYLALHSQWMPLAQSMPEGLIVTKALNGNIIYSAGNKKSEEWMRSLSRVRPDAPVGSGPVWRWTEAGWVEAGAIKGHSN